jgi:predicted P-loop ATPase
MPKNKPTGKEIATTVAAKIAASVKPPIARLNVNWPETNAKGAPLKNSMVNSRMAIQALKLDCKLNVFSGRYEINGSNLQSFVGELSDKVTRKVRELSFSHLGMEPGLEAMYQGIMRACEQHMYDPLVDKLDSLEWDGVKRLDTWLMKYAGVEDTPLHRAWGRIVLTAAARRIRDHGCKFDHVLVLEGPEGKDKSSLVQVLASGKQGGREYFSDSTILNKDEKQQMELTTGVWFYEIAELAGMRKADVFAVKAFITRQEDRARPAYGRFKELQPRVCIFIGTFNTTGAGETIEYLNLGDNRRWWPVTVGKIDIPALERDRDQLFAEADFEANVNGASIKLPQEFWEDATAIQKSREISDPLADRLSTLCRDVQAKWRGDARALAEPEKQGETYRDSSIVQDGIVSVTAKYVLSKLPATMTSDGRRIIAAMRKEGWKNFHDRRFGHDARGYEHDCETLPDAVPLDQDAIADFADDDPAA